MRTIRLGDGAYDVHTGTGELIALVSGPDNFRTWLVLPDLDAAEALMSAIRLGIEAVHENHRGTPAAIK